MRKFTACALCLVLLSFLVCSCEEAVEDLPVVDLGGGTEGKVSDVEDTYQPPHYGGDAYTDTSFGSDPYESDGDNRDPIYRDAPYEINMSGNYAIKSESVYKIDVLIGSSRHTRYGRVVALLRENGVPAVYLDVLDEEQKTVLCSKIFNGMCKVFMDSDLESLFVYTATVNADGRCVLNAGAYMVSDIDQTGAPLGNNGEVGFVSVERGNSQTIQLTQSEAINKNLLQVIVDTLDEKTSEMYCTIADTVSQPVTYDVGMHEKVDSAEKYLTWEILKEFYEKLFSN